MAVPWERRPGSAANSAAGWIPDRRPIYLGINSVPIPNSSEQKAADEDANTVVVASSQLDDTGSKRSNAIRSRVSAAGVMSKYVRVPAREECTDTQVHIRRCASAACKRCARGSLKHGWLLHSF